MAKKDTTQSGVLEQETETGVQASPNPRNDFLEQLAAQNHEAVKAELIEAGLEQPDTAAPAASAEPAPAATNNAPHILSEDELATLQVKTKIDGVEEIRPVGDVLRNYQKDAAASQRLREAAQRQAELDAREQDLRQREESLLSGANNSTQANLSNLDEQAGELVSALYEGDEEKTKEAVKKLLGERQQATPQQNIDPAQLAAEVERQLETKKAFKAFGENYQEIVADPVLAQVADTYLAKQLQDGVELNVALTNAGNATRDWLSAHQPVVSNANDRQQRKEQIYNIPAASQKSGSPETPISGEESASETIKQMRISRGLSV